jgi:uncharacterized protein YndB with AHSA1/START domain
MTASDSARDIRITRVYDAPLARVWDAFTDDAQASQWWGPRGFTITTHSKDLRPGGTWVYTMHGPDGTDWPNFTRYHEVEHHARLVYDHGASSEDSAPMFRMTVLFRELGDRTELALCMTLPSPEAAQQARVFIKAAGGNATWDRLAEYLEAQSSRDEVFVINRQPVRRTRHGPRGECTIGLLASLERGKESRPFGASVRRARERRIVQGRGLEVGAPNRRMREEVQDEAGHTRYETVRSCHALGGCVPEAKIRWRDQRPRPLRHFGEVFVRVGRGVFVRCRRTVAIEDGLHECVELRVQQVRALVHFDRLEAALVHAVHGERNEGTATIRQPLGVGQRLHEERATGARRQQRVDQPRRSGQCPRGRHRLPNESRALARIEPVDDGGRGEQRHERDGAIRHARPAGHPAQETADPSARCGGNRRGRISGERRHHH